MSSDGLCRYCGAYIGTENWESCPNCGEDFSDGDEGDEDGLDAVDDEWDDGE